MILFIKLLVAIEEEFNIVFSDDDFEFSGDETFNSILELLEKKVHA